jgi:hypothetical protein
MLMPQLDRPKRPGEDEANEEENTAEVETSAEGDSSAEQTDALSGDAVAALPAPEAPDMLTPNLQAGEQPMPVEPAAELPSDEATAAASAEASVEVAAGPEANPAVEAAPPVGSGEKLEEAKADPKVPA